MISKKQKSPMKIKFILFTKFLTILFLQLNAQKLYKVDLVDNNTTKTIYINSIGEIVIKPDSSGFLIGNSQSVDGVVAIQFTDKKSNSSKVVLFDSLGKEFKTFEEYTYATTNHNLHYENYLAILKRGKDANYYYNSGGEMFFRAPYIIINSKGEIVLEVKDNNNSELRYAGNGYFSYQTAGYFNLVKSKIDPIKVNENILGRYWIPNVSSDLIPFKFERKIENLNSTPNSKYGYINLKGQVPISPEYQYAHPFSCDRAFVEIANDKSILIDNFGKRITDKFFYSTFELFQEDLISVKTYPDNNFYRFIDINGNFAFDGKFSYASQFKFGKALVSEDNRTYYLIDKLGNRLPFNTYIGQGTWWDNRILYDGFSGAFISLTNGKTVYRDSKKIIEITKISQLENYPNLDLVDGINISGFHFNNGNPVTYLRNTDKLTNLKSVSLFIDENTKNLNIEPIFKNKSIKSLRIIGRYGYSLDEISTLKDLEEIQFDITGRKKLPKNINNLSKLKKITLEGEPTTEFINELFKLNKGINIIFKTHYYLKNTDKLKLSKYFNNIVDEFGNKILDSRLEKAIISEKK
jgi:hypothetical protein